MIISVDFSDTEIALITKIAEQHGLCVSEFIRQTVFERIEDECDLKAYEATIEEYLADPVTYTHDEVKELFSKSHVGE